MDNSMIVQVFKTPEPERRLGNWRISVNHGDWGYYAKSLGHAEDIVRDIAERYATRNLSVTIDARG